MKRQRQHPCAKILGTRQVTRLPTAHRLQVQRVIVDLRFDPAFQHFGHDAIAGNLGKDFGGDGDSEHAPSAFIVGVDIHIRIAPEREILVVGAGKFKPNQPTLPQSSQLLNPHTRLQVAHPEVEARRRPYVLPDTGRLVHAGNAVVP